MNSPEMTQMEWLQKVSFNINVSLIEQQLGLKFGLPALILISNIQLKARMSFTMCFDKQ